MAQARGRFRGAPPVFRGGERRGWGGADELGGLASEVGAAGEALALALALSQL